jgi:hypothetical protein
MEENMSLKEILVICSEVSFVSNSCFPAHLTHGFLPSCFHFFDQFIPIMCRGLKEKSVWFKTGMRRMCFNLLKMEG